MSNGTPYQLMPTFCRILVKVDKERAVSDGGIYIPDVGTMEKPRVGTVAAVGPGRLLENGTTLLPCVSLADRVLIPQYCGTDIKHEQGDYVLLQDTEVLCILQPVSVEALELLNKCMG